MGKLPLLAGCEAGPLHQPLGMTGLTGFLLPTGPLLQTSDGKEMEEGTIRYLVQPRGPRSGPGPWQGGRRKFRRQRPRLSHKGPMPF